MSVAYVGLLASLLAMSEPAFADLKIDSPQPVQYSCPSGTDLLGGKCSSKEVKPVQLTCESGFTMQDGTCVRSESTQASTGCPADFTFNSPLFPNQCSMLMGSDTAETSCSDTFTDSTKVGSDCYYVRDPQDLQCPADAPEATPHRVETTCSSMAQAMGKCGDQTSSYTTYDQRWILNAETSMCSRTIYSSIKESCPAGFNRDGDGCVKETSTEPTAYCEEGYYRDGNQCMRQKEESCGPGTTMRYGVCVSPSGDLSCPSGQHLEEYSNLCVKDHVRADPVSINDDDYSYYFNQGANLSRNIAKTISTPSLASTGNGVDGISISAEFLNAQTKLEDKDLFKAVDIGGVDGNNDFPSPDGTYQDEDKQNEFIRKQLDANEQFIANEGNIEGQTSEEIVDNTNHSAVAYDTLMQARNLNPVRKLSSDSPLFETSRNAVSDAFNGQGQFFGDCSSETTTYQELDESKIVKTTNTCMKPNLNNLSGCVVDRTLIKPSINIIKGRKQGKEEMCGENCVLLTLGDKEDDSIEAEGQCGVVNKQVVMSFTKGNELESAELIGGKYDGEMRISADEQVFVNGLSKTYGTSDGFPSAETGCPATPGKSVSPADVTEIFKKGFADDNRIVFNYQAAVGETGSAYAQVRLHFKNPISTHWSEKYDYSPKGCNERLEQEDTFCTADDFVCDEEVEWIPIDLGDWATEDHNGRWVIMNNINDVRQEINGDATSFISEKSFDLNSFRGRIRVNDHHDDDFIGFLFGVPEKGADRSLPENSWYVVSWKQHHQDGASEGIVLAKVVGNMNAINYKHQESIPGTYEVLATNLGMGWAADQEYKFQLDIRPDHFTLHINDEVKIDVDGEFHQGRVAFYNRSQSDVIYSQVEQLYPAGLGRDAKYVFKPLWDGAPDYPVCMTGHRENYVCDPLKGKRIESNGGSFSFKDIIHMDDACVALDEDPSCDAISQECVEGWKDEETNTCYAWNVKYECQDTSNAYVTKVKENNSCMTDLNCIDGSCNVHAEETNQDFTNALTTYAAMNELGQNRTCSDPDDITTCEIFTGSPEWCGYDQLKINDCCKDQSGTNPIDIFAVGRNMVKITSYAADEKGAFGGTALQKALKSTGEQISGSWKTVVETTKTKTIDAGKLVLDKGKEIVEKGAGALNDATGLIDKGKIVIDKGTAVVKDAAKLAKKAWGTVTSAFTGAEDSTTGNAATQVVSKAGEWLGDFISGPKLALQKLQNQMLEKVWNLMPKAMQQAIKQVAGWMGVNLGPDATGAQVLKGMGAQVKAYIGYIGWAYTIYEMTKMAYMMLTACSDDELQTASNIHNKKCFKTYTKPCKKVLGVCINRAKDFHCCYESVISRIIMQQSIQQLGIDKKRFQKDLDCRGLKIAELKEINFSKIDFSEWVNMMAEADMIPVDKTMVDLTAGEHLSNNFGRQDTLTRNLERGKDNALENARKDMNGTDVGNNIDCNSRPRPLSCEQGAFTPNQ